MAKIDWNKIDFGPVVHKPINIAPPKAKSYAQKPSTAPAFQNNVADWSKIQIYSYSCH